MFTVYLQNSQIMQEHWKTKVEIFFCPGELGLVCNCTAPRHLSVCSQMWIRAKLCTHRVIVNVRTSHLLSLLYSRPWVSFHISKYGCRALRMATGILLYGFTTICSASLYDGTFRLPFILPPPNCSPYQVKGTLLFGFPFLVQHPPAPPPQGGEASTNT